MKVHLTVFSLRLTVKTENYLVQKPARATLPIRKNGKTEEFLTSPLAIQ